MHVATHPARPVTVRPAKPGKFAGADMEDPDVFWLGPVLPAVVTTARRLAHQREMALLMGRPL